MIVVGTKPGDVLALDPDRQGALLWRIIYAAAPPWATARPAPGGGVSGAARPTASRLLRPVRRRRGGGAHGEWRAVWFNGPGFGPCADAANLGAAASGIPGAVLLGGADGRITALRPRTAACLWTLQTAKPFDTVNKVPAHGGSLISSGVTVAGGMMFIGSGYAIANGAPGNVLLAYSRR